MGKDDEFI